MSKTIWVLIFIVKVSDLSLLNLSDRYVPTLLKSLRSQKVVHICCGEDHTAALTKVQNLKICLCSNFFMFPGEDAT